VQCHFIVFHFTCLLNKNSLPVVRCAQHFQRMSAARSSGSIDEKYNSSLESATASLGDNLIPGYTATSCFSNIQFAICSYSPTHIPFEVFFTVEIFHLDSCGKLVICPVHSLYSTQPIISVITVIIQGSDIT